MSKENFKSIALLSTHGFFDPVPKLGRTDTGGQVVYVLEMAKAMAKKGIKVDIYTRWFEKEKILASKIILSKELESKESELLSLDYFYEREIKSMLNKKRYISSEQLFQ